MNKKIITATLLISDGPVEHAYFIDLLNISPENLINLLSEINSEMRNIELGFEIKYDKNKSDIKTISEISTYLNNVKPPSILKGLSTPALETLAIVAYEQPVTKLKISEIRGVESESSIKTLEARGLIETDGQLDVPGNPMLYKTTSLFLEKTNISSLEDLPSIGEYFNSPNEEE
ncbi:MAG: SMC-Scp complex subunit ScpB [Candidatus Actinomarinales bacterium]|nr:MAG: SMC-Scp complex subunit ScpB [Candidatus Actinomarinales bacterium]